MSLYWKSKSCCFGSRNFLKCMMLKIRLKIEEIDGKIIETKLGNIVEVENSFKYCKSPFRVNIIGYSKDELICEEKCY